MLEHLLSFFNQLKAYLYVVYCNDNMNFTQIDLYVRVHVYLYM